MMTVYPAITTHTFFEDRAYYHRRMCFLSAWDNFILRKASSNLDRNPYFKVTRKKRLEGNLLIVLHLLGAALGFYGGPIVCLFFSL